MFDVQRLENIPLVFGVPTLTAVVRLSVGMLTITGDCGRNINNFSNVGIKHYFYK